MNTDEQATKIVDGIVREYGLNAKLLEAVAATLNKLVRRISSIKILERD